MMAEENKRALERYVEASKALTETGARIRQLLEDLHSLTRQRPPDWDLVVETIKLNDALLAAESHLATAVKAYETEADPKVAEALCRRVHEGQTRDDGRPYAVHPESVVRILRSYGLLDYRDEVACQLKQDRVTECIAWVHDAEEDTNCTNEEITALLGTAVGCGAKLLTNKHPDGTPFEVRQAALLEHAARMRASKHVVAVKLADRLDNLSDIDHWEPWRRKRYAVAALDLVDALEPIQKGRKLAHDVRALAQRIIAECEDADG